MFTKIDTGNTKGITRKFDELNRIVIPMEILKERKLSSKRVEIFNLENGIYIEFDEVS